MCWQYSGLKNGLFSFLLRVFNNKCCCQWRASKIYKRNIFYTFKYTFSLNENTSHKFKLCLEERMTYKASIRIIHLKCSIFLFIFISQRKEIFKTIANHWNCLMKTRLPFLYPWTFECHPKKIERRHKHLYSFSKVYTCWKSPLRFIFSLSAFHTSISRNTISTHWTVSFEPLYVHQNYRLY